MERTIPPMKRLEFHHGYLDLNWATVYELLGLEHDYKSFHAEYLVQTGWESMDMTKFGPWWSIPVIKGVTYKKIIDAYRHECKIKMYLYYEDLDHYVWVDRQMPEFGSYVVHAHKDPEADKNHAVKSAEDLRVNGVNGITLCERLLLGLGYFITMAAYPTIERHLDVDGETLCSGSKYRNLAVPGVMYVPEDDEVCVLKNKNRSRSHRLRTREVF